MSDNVGGDRLTIVVGRRVRFWGGMGGMDADGTIVKVTGELLPPQHESSGVVRFVRRGEARARVVLDDGRVDEVLQGSFDRVGIGYRLLPVVVGPAAVEGQELLVQERFLREQRERASALFALLEQQRSVVVDDPVLFYWNGIKDAKGAKLQKAAYNLTSNTKYPDGTITIYARDYCHFSAKVHGLFNVKNDSDLMTDYFDNDRFYVTPVHPLHGAVKAAMEAWERRWELRKQRRSA